MSLILVLLAGSVFVYLACNLGANKRRPGHGSYGCKPVAIFVILAGLTLLCWPLIGPLVTRCLALFCTPGTTNDTKRKEFHHDHLV